VDFLSLYAEQPGPRGSQVELQVDFRR